MAVAKVLLAEDDTTMVSLLTTLLGMEGFQVAALLPDDPDVQTAVRREKPDIVLLDVHLPGQNGVDIIRDLRKHADTRGLRVVMSSGLNLKSECMSAGADAFIQKPYMPDDLLRLLKV